LYNQFKNGTFSIEYAQAWGALDMSMGYTDRSIKCRIACIA